MNSNQENKDEELKEKREEKERRLSLVWSLKWRDRGVIREGREFFL